MKNNLLLAGLLTLSSSSLFCAQPALSKEAQDLINQANEIQITRNGDSVTFTLGEKSKTITVGTNRSGTAFGKILVGVTVKELFGKTEIDPLKVNFFTLDEDRKTFPGFERMQVQNYALILEKTV